MKKYFLQAVISFNRKAIDLLEKFDTNTWPAARVDYYIQRTDGSILDFISLLNEILNRNIALLQHIYSYYYIFWLRG